MRPIKGKLYKTLKDCLLWEDDYNMTKFANVKVPEYSIVMYVEPNPENNYEAKIIYKDIIGYIHTSALGVFVSTENLNYAESKETP